MDLAGPQAPLAQQIETAANSHKSSSGLRVALLRENFTAMGWSRLDY
jgi:hypothetical protein